MNLVTGPGKRRAEDDKVVKFPKSRLQQYVFFGIGRLGNAAETLNRDAGDRAVDRLDQFTVRVTGIVGMAVREEVAVRQPAIGPELTQQRELRALAHSAASSSANMPASSAMRRRAIST